MFEAAIKIAANSIKELRMPDVYRVLEQNDNRDALAAYIADNRPDLAHEIWEIMEEGF